jgi:hypothetical protein
MHGGIINSGDVCILDPDGDIVRNLRATGRASRHAGWPCYHTELYMFCHDGHEYGIVGCAVGAAFAVLIAEELFASGWPPLRSNAGTRLRGRGIYRRTKLGYSDARGITAFVL